MENRFRKSLLNKEEFTVSLEIVAGRGGLEKAQERAVETAKWAMADERISAVSITDSPGGRPGIDPAFMALEIKKIGMEPIIHYTLKDKNRLKTESELYGYQRNGLHNLIIMTGDYPKRGYINGNGKPVFDIDPIHALELISDMNCGLDVGKNKVLQPSMFFSGCVVTPFKNVEAEIITEYIKLEKKARYADFIISQVGYDMRKFHELRQFCNEICPQIPLIGNIFILDRNLAELIHLHRFTGCTIPEKLYRHITAEGVDDKRLGLVYAAKMFAVMKGIGYDGAHIGGEHLTHDDIDFVITEGNELAASWESCLKDFEGFDDGAFYYYHKDNANGLNLPIKNDLALLPIEEKLSPKYRLLRRVHNGIYEQNGMLAKLAAAVGRKAAKGGLCRGAERALRAGFFHCRDCGDCAMAYTDLICPMVHCPKQQRNGPCGGSRNGFCELYPNKKKCIYVTAYNRLKIQNKIDDLRMIAEPPNCGLYGTSEFNNFFTGKDTYGKRKRKDTRNERH